MSNIDPSKPEEGFATTQSVRDNFQAAADEIDANVSAISAAQAQITQNASAISANTTQISANTSQISQNTADIAQNQADIASNSAAIQAGGLPVGIILNWATVTPPTNWLICDGQPIPSQYAALIALLGVNTPNLSGRFVRGASGSRAPLTTEAEQLGRHNHTASASFSGNQLPGHAHNAGSGDWTGRAVANTGGNSCFSNQTDRPVGGMPRTNSVSGGRPSGSVSVTVNNSAAGENRPANTALHYIIYAGPPT